MLTNSNIPKVSKLKYDMFDDCTYGVNLMYLCMNYVRDSGFRLSELGYDTKPLDDMITYFETHQYWEYDPSERGYELFNVCDYKNMSEVDELHELKHAYKCLNTIKYDVDDDDFCSIYLSVKSLYERAYYDCVKVLCYGWRRGEPVMDYELKRYDELCEQQKVINEREKTDLCSLFD